MVRTRGLATALIVVMLGVMLAVPIVARDEPIDFADAPFVIFAPAPPLPDEISDYPLPDGAEDFWQLWSDDSAWSDALEHIDAFAMHAWMLRYSSTDEELRRLFAWLDEHDILFGLEVEPLTWPGPDVCDHTEGFEGPYDLEEIRRIRGLGGRLDFLSLDEPYSHAHSQQGPGACGYPVEQVVDETWDFVKKVRGLFPGVPVGTIEPIVSDPVLRDDDFAEWLDTWAQRTGEPFAFLNIDVDWRIEDWPTRVLGAEAVADARDIPFGMLYLGSEFSRQNDRWLDDLAHHAATFEQGHGGTPDLVGFYSWHSQPDRLLPDDDVNAFTGRLNQYFGQRTELEAPSVEGKAVRGRLTTTEGQPLPGAVLSVMAEPLDGARSRHRLSGTVPASAERALIAVRGNIEGGAPSPLDVRISEVSYREDGGKNRVPNPRFAKGLESWGAYGSGKVAAVGRKGKPAVRLQAGPRQTILIDGETFKVRPGAEYDFAATLDVPGKSLGSGYISVIFLGDTEVARENLWFTAPPLELPPATTDDQGRYRIPLGSLRPGRWDLVISYDGDLDRWAAEAASRVRVR